MIRNWTKHRSISNVDNVWIIESWQKVTGKKEACMRILEKRRRELRENVSRGMRDTMWRKGGEEGKAKERQRYDC